MDKETRNQILSTLATAVIAGLGFAAGILIHPLLFFVGMVLLIVVDYLSGPKCSCCDMKKKDDDGREG